MPLKVNTYTYAATGWKDRLLEYGEEVRQYNGEGIAYEYSYSGSKIEYDEIGNPTAYLGKTLEWKNGRQLATVSEGGSEIAAYTYTPSGTRLSKTVGGVKTEYTLDGSTILRQTTGEEILNFYYDSAGNVVSMGYKKDANTAEVNYFVSRNAQGDIGLYEPSVAWRRQTREPTHGKHEAKPKCAPMTWDSGDIQQQ